LIIPHREGNFPPSSGGLRNDRRIFGLMARIVRARIAEGPAALITDDERLPDFE
jgi:hypothetical protein